VSKRPATEEEVIRAARQLDGALREVARRFYFLISDLRHVHPDVRFALCGAGGGEGLSQTAIEIFDALRFDKDSDVQMFEELLRAALTKQKQFSQQQKRGQRP
jgi:hypothetical protein